MSSLTCGDRSGFLFAHACDRLATGQCVRCGKPICVEHTRMTESGPTCVACLRDDSGDRDHGDHDRSSGSSDSSSSSPAREPGFAPGGGEFGGAGAGSAWAQGATQGAARADDPYFYGGPAAYYDADDVRAFDAVAPAEAGESGAAAAEGAADDADLESDTGAS